MITILERENISGDYIVKTDKGTKIGVDSVKNTINILATRSIGIDGSEEFTKAIELANMIASGKLSLKEKQEIDWLSIDCTVGGMPNNSKGYIYFSALYVSIDDLSIRVNSSHYPMYQVPLSDDYVILIRNSEGKFQVSKKDIKSKTCTIKKHNNADPIINVI